MVSSETSKDIIPSIMHTTVAACTQPKWPNQVVFIVVNLVPSLCSSLGVTNLSHEFIHYFLLVFDSKGQNAQGETIHILGTVCFTEG